jgi:hypothetical protein
MNTHNPRSVVHPPIKLMPENFNAEWPQEDIESRGVSKKQYDSNETSLPSSNRDHSEGEEVLKKEPNASLIKLTPENFNAEWPQVDIESRGVSNKKQYDSDETSLPSSKKEHSETEKVLKKEQNASLILGAERTLFAALNNAWLLAIGGIGLMSVGNDDERATHGGACILSLAIASTSMAYGMHVWRMNQMKNNKSFQLSHTIVWSSVIAALTLATLGLELYFGIMHPYLAREKTVVIAGGL